jgi:RNA polymerase sigma-70 factor (ECF subfamily)
MDEAVMVRRAADGDEAAFEELIARHAPAMLALARARTRDAMLAEEIAQDAFVRLFRHVSAFRGESSLRTWLVRVVMNLCVDAQRRDPRRFETTIDLATGHRSADEGPGAAAPGRRSHAARGPACGNPLPCAG